MHVFLFVFLNVNAKKKAKCTNSNYFKTKAIRQFPFQRREREQTNSTICLFERKQQALRLFEMHQFETETKVK